MRSFNQWQYGRKPDLRFDVSQPPYQRRRNAQYPATRKKKAIRAL